MSVPQKKKRTLSQRERLEPAVTSVTERSKIQEFRSKIIDLIGRDHSKAVKILEDWIKTQIKK